jgi:hypothetical protein
VTYDRTCTTSSVQNGCVSIAADLTGGCTASGPVSPIVNNNGGITYQRACPTTGTKTVNFAPGSNCAFNNGMYFSGGNICGSYRCNETRAITSGGAAIPAAVTGTGVSVQGQNQVCGTWSGINSCSTQTQYHRCVHSPYACPHGGNPATCWSNITPSVQSDCGACTTSDYVYNIKLTRTCSGSCTPNTETCVGYQCYGSYPAPVTEMCPPGMRADPNGKETYWRFQGCNNDGTKYYSNWDLSSSTCKSETAGMSGTCATSKNFSGTTVLGYMVLPGSSSLPCAVGSGIGGVAVAYAGTDLIGVGAGLNYGALNENLLSPRGPQSVTLGATGCVLGLNFTGGGVTGNTGTFNYRASITDPISNMQERLDFTINANITTDNELTLCFNNI